MTYVNSPWPALVLQAAELRRRIFVVNLLWQFWFVPLADAEQAGVDPASGFGPISSNPALRWRFRQSIPELMR